MLPFRALSLVVALAGLAGLAQAEPAVVLYPGSFDPFHLAHRQELRVVHERLLLRHPEGVTLVVLPNHDRPKHIPKGYSFAARLRVRLARAANAELPFVRVHEPFADGVETERQLLTVAAEHPGKKTYLLLGKDAYAGLREWVGAARVLDAFHLIVSTAPAHLDALAAPGTMLGGIGRGYRKAGARTWVDEDAHVIEAMPVRVSEIRSHPILLRLLLGEPVQRLVGRRVATLLTSARYRDALAKAAISLLEGSTTAIGAHVGDALAHAATHDALVATSLLALSNTTDARIVARVARNLRERGYTVPLSRLRALAKDPAHAKIFDLHRQRSARRRA